MKIIVVGSGVLGVSVARSLAVAGEEVLLLDKRGAGTGTSATTFAWTNANRKLDPSYHRLNVAGMEEHAVLAGTLPGEPSYFRSGALQWADSANELWLANNVDRLRSLGYPTRWVTRDEATRIAGRVRIPSAATSVAHFPSEGYVLPDRFLQNLLADAELVLAKRPEFAEPADGEDLDDPEAHDVHLTATGRRALTATAAVLVLYVAAVVALLLVPGSPLLGKNGSIVQSAVVLNFSVVIALLFAVLGFTYGRTVGTIPSPAALPPIMADGVRAIAPVIVLFFAVAQFLAYFAWTGIGSVLTAQDADLLRSMNTVHLVVLLGTVKSFTMPIAVVILVGWSLLFAIWYGLGIPLGPGVPLR